MNKDSVRLSDQYSGNFPLQFMDVYHTGTDGGIYLISQDTSNAPKKFYLNKQNGKIDMGIIRRPRLLAPGETWTLPPMALCSMSPMLRTVSFRSTARGSSF